MCVKNVESENSFLLFFVYNIVRRSRVKNWIFNVALVELPCTTEL